MGAGREEFCFLDSFKSWPHFKITWGHRGLPAERRGWGKSTVSLPDWLQLLCLIQSTSLSFGASLTFPQKSQEQGISQVTSCHSSCDRRALALKAGLMDSPSDLFLSLGFLITHRMRSHFSNVSTQSQMMPPHPLPDKAVFVFYVKIISGNEGNSQNPHTLPCFAFRKWEVQTVEVKRTVKYSYGPTTLGSIPLRLGFGFCCVDSSCRERIGQEVREMERHISLFSFIHMLVFNSEIL